MNTSCFLRSSVFPRFRLRAWSRAAVVGLAATGGLCDGLQAQSIVLSGEVSPSPAVSPVWNVGGDLNIGITTMGRMFIQDGAQVNNASGNVGVAGISGGGDGSVVVTGTGSLWTNTGTLTVGGGFGGLGFLTIENGGRVVAGGPMVISANNGSTGSVYVGSGGILEAGGVSGILAGASYAFVLDGGTLRVGGLNLTTSVNATLNSNSTVDTNGLNATLTGTLSSTGGLEKAGAGSLTLTRANTYSGGTTLTAGRLRIGNNAALGTGTLTLQGGTTLSSDGGTRTIANAIVLNGDVSIMPEDASLFRVFTLNGAVNLGGATRTITNPSRLGAGEFGRVTFGGAISNGGLTLVGPATDNGGVFFTMNGAQANTYTGTTTVGELVSLQLGKTGGAIAIAGDLVIENDGVAVIVPGEQIADTAAITVRGIGRLQVGNGAAVTETFGSLFGDGEVRLYAGGGNGSTVRTGSGSFAGQITGGFAGTTSLEKTGAGTLVLTGANTYLGNTLISAGTLQVGDGGTTGSLGAGGVTDNAALVFNRADSFTVANVISGTGTLTQQGAGVLTLTGANTYSGVTTVSAGTLRIGDGGTTGSLGTGNVTDNAALVFDRSDAITVANLISGTGTLTKQGAGTLTLTRANTYGGGTTLAAGTLSIGNNSALGTGVLTIADGTTISTNGSPRTITNNLVINGNFTVLPTGTNFLSTAFALNGAMDLNGGTRTITNPFSLAAFQFGLASFGGVISNGGLDFETVPTSTAAFFRMNGAQSNTYTGDTTVGTAASLDLAKTGGATAIAGNLIIRDNGVAVVSRSEQIADTSTVTINGIGRFQLGSSTDVTETVGTLLGDGLVALNNRTTGSTLRVGAGNFSGVIYNGVAGGTSLEKTGAGTLVLTGGNTYLGNTVISGGILQIGDGGTAGSLGAGGVTDNAALVFNRSDSFTVANVISGTGTLAKRGAGVLTLTGTNTYAGGTTVNGGLIEFAAAANLGAGNVTLDGGGLRWATGNTTDISARLNPLGAGGGVFDTNGNDVVFASALTGPGQLTKTGAGALTLGAANTYTGGTLVLGGELVVSSASLPGDATVGTGAFLTFDQNTDGTYSGRISGAGDVRINGTGTLVLTGANTYLGNTVISGGTLQVGDGGTAGSLGAGGVTDNAALVFNRSDSFTVANVISGTGTLAKQGAGILTLTGANTYAGGTTVTGGLIEFAAATNLGTGNVTLDGGGLRWATGNTTDISARLNPLGAGGGVFDTNGNDVVFASALGGAGQLTKTGAGALTLGAANTYTGGTLVLGGELVVSSASLPGDATVGTGAFLTFDQNTDGTYSGRISGAGDVRTNGNGTVTFTAVQAYTGQTAINTGALQATTEIIADRDITVGSGAALILNQTTDGGYAGTLTGAGGLVKTGAGTVILSQDQTYTGPTVVNAGGLRVNAALASDSLTVGNGAFLGGSGSVAGAVVIQSGGTLAPGNSPGILTVGSLVLNAGSFTQMEINGPGVAGVDYDQIRVTGEATLGGTLDLLLGGGYVPQDGDSFVLVDAASITAGSDFAVVNGLGNALTFTATITDDYTLTINVVQTDFEPFALTFNQRAVARDLDGDLNNPALGPVIDALNALPGTSLPAAFDLIAPEEYAALPRFVQSNTRAMWSGLRRRLAEIRGGSTGWSVSDLNVTGRSGRLDLNNQVLLAAVGDTADAIGMRALAAQAQAEKTPPEERRGFFVSGTGTFGDNEDDGNAAGYDFAAGGIVLGTDLRLTPDAAVGVMAGYGHTETDYQGASSNLDTETARAGLYGTWSGLHHSWLNATAGGAYHWYDSKREGLGGTASGTTQGAELNALVEAGRDFQAGRWTLTPSAGADYLWLRMDGFEEHGSLAPLVLNRRTDESLRGELALTAAYRIQAGDKSWSPYLRVGWQHEFLDTQAAVAARLASGAGGIFTVKGSRQDRDSAILGTGLQARLGPALEAGVAYSGELNNDYQTHSVNANVRLRF